jgi:hypothetical protein
MVAKFSKGPEIAGGTANAKARVIIFLFDP